MNPLIVTVILLVGLIPVQGSRDRQERKGTAPRLAQEDDIREAVFRYEFRHNSSIQGQRAGVYCLSIGEKNTDPPDDFIKRFVGFKPPVRKASDCSTDPYSGVVEKKTGKQGLVFRVRSIKWLSDTEVQVIGGYFENGLSASGDTYTLIRTPEKWRVSKARTNWISYAGDHATRFA
ncbi:MAG TPA: hypothetical protein VFO39_09170 [Candidatus Sulfotelmatobacter sp.]|nr:hypothetical protein [Candidatus Sulfotelmatobacter sp.]